jgi:homogentisate 1,2-dioxygenase
MHYVKGKVPRQAHVAIPEGLYEEEHGRQGFFGRVVQLYHQNPPMRWKRIEGPLRPRGFYTHRLEPTDLVDPRGEPVTILENRDVRISVSRRSEAMPYCFRNGDGDEIRFVHKGRGVLHTDFGPLRYAEGDYIVIPKGTTYRVLPETPDTFTLIIQSRGEVGFPNRGGVGEYAPFDYGLLETPEPEPMAEEGREWELRIRRRGQDTAIFYDFYPFDVVGWKGTLAVFKLNIKDIRPLTSEGIHLPPSAHGTFQAPGFVVCTIVPQPLPSDPQATKLPWDHRNIDYDEVFFLHAGEFTPGPRMGPAPLGFVNMNPQGLHHGPPPEAHRHVQGRSDARLDHVRINIDTEEPLAVSPEAEAVEFKDFADVWSTG